MFMKTFQMIRVESRKMHMILHVILVELQHVSDNFSGFQIDCNHNLQLGDEIVLLYF